MRITFSQKKRRGRNESYRHLVNLVFELIVLSPQLFDIVEGNNHCSVIHLSYRVLLLLDLPSIRGLRMGLSEI